jgi:branched-chain amino acid transport system ATP-binding protein
MLELVDVTGGWGPTTIVENVSMTVHPGETVGIIGRNGVGKSTLLELIANRAQLTSGSILLNGQDATLLPTHQRARLGLGYVPQEREVFASLTVREHVVISEVPGKWTRDLVLSLFPSLAERLDSKAGTLSGGEQQMLAIARALLGNPSVLLLDEPSEGLAPVVVEKLIGSLQALAGDRAIAILLVEQRIDIALELSDRYLIMDRGRIVQGGLTDELRRQQDELPAMMGLQA